MDALRQFDVLDTAPEQALDNLTALAAHICGAPIALISLIDGTRQWFKSNIGMAVSETPREVSFCGHTILGPDLFIVRDAAKDRRFADNPLVTGDPHIRFYAGGPLRTPDGHALGTLCVMDHVPRRLSLVQQSALRVLSQQAMSQLELRRQTRQLEASEERLFQVFRNCPVALAIHRFGDRTFVEVNDAFTTLLGWERADVQGRTTEDLGIIDPDGAAKIRAHLHAAGALRDAELVVRRRDGDIRHILMGTSLVELRGETHTITTFVDLTARKVAEEARRASDARYQTLFEYAPDGILIADSDSIYLDANASMCRMLGYSRSELVGLGARDIVVAEETPHIGPALDAIKSESDYHREWQFRRKDGSVFSADVMATMIPDGNLLGMVRDITERRHAEERIRHLNRVYAVLSDINQIIVRGQEPQAMLPAACRIAVEQGQFRMAYVGMLDAADGRTHIAAHAGATPDTLAFLRSLLGQAPLGGGCAMTAHALQSGEHGVSNNIASDPRAESWREAAMARGYRAMAALPLKAGGRVVGTFNLYAGETDFFDDEEVRLLDELAQDIGFALDVHDKETERRRVGHALRESDERFRQVVENIQEVFWMTDPATQQMLYISPAYETIWGRTCAALYAAPETWLEAIHPDDRARIAAAADAKHTRGDYAETYRIVRPDGTVRWIRDRAFPVRGSGARVLRVVGTAEDITERRHLEEQLRQAQKMEAIGQLAGGVAHDFNNLLTVIQGYGSLLMMEEQTREEMTEAGEAITDACERAANLTRQLLAFSRKQVMQSRQLDLNEIVTSLAKMLQRIVGEDVRLQLNLHPHPLMTRADGGMLDQVLMNLVVNARDAMPGGGQLYIETTERTFTEDEARATAGASAGRYVGLRVRDTGSGISPEHLSRIFEPFFTTKEPGKGTGLGLATVFGVVAQHGGLVQVESTPGGGTTFHVFLSAAPDTPETLAEERAKPKPRGGTETILVVEDEPAVRALTRVVLERAGYRVLEATHGVDALQVWNQHTGTIHLVLTDIVMPEGMSGRQLATQLQAFNPTVRVLFTSGYSPDIAGRELSLREGENFIQKPAALHHLLETVRRCLDG